jgi:NAD(P)-dependent dehydrogenase (short-subunit alcohol dehydrogenase family)
MSPDADLEGRVVAIAGAAGGLGPVVAHELAGRGAALALAERDGARLEQVRGELRSADERIHTHVADLLEPGAAEDWAASVLERFGRVDALVHLVGGWRGGKPIDEAPPSDDAWLHDLLVRTVQTATRAFLPALRASGHGRFAIVSSAQAQHPTATNAAYASAKAAAEAWTLALAADLGEHGGTANIVVVNAIVTPEMRAADPEKPFRTFTDAADIASSIAYLLSDAAAKMNGQRLSLHG